MEVLMKTKELETKATETLLYQLLETELGGVQVYQTALSCVQNEDLKEEWEKYLTETKRHVVIARGVVQAAGLDPDADVPARMPVRMMGVTLVKMMQTAILAGDHKAAEITACECVVEAETKDHSTWELVAELVKKATGDLKKVLREACDEVEPQEDHHLYHMKGWCRELWMDGLGLGAELPPPEEKKDVETAIGAERAKNARHPSRHHHS
jgi:hypothetical protein